MAAPKSLEHIVILCFESRYPKQNSVIRLKSNILAPQKFWADYATACRIYFVTFSFENIYSFLFPKTLKELCPIRGPHAA